MLSHFHSVKASKAHVLNSDCVRMCFQFMNAYRLSDLPLQAYLASYYLNQWSYISAYFIHSFQTWPLLRFSEACFDIQNPSLVLFFHSLSVNSTPKSSTLSSVLA